MKMEQKPTPEQLERARRIAAEHTGTQSEAGADILAGKRDGNYGVQCALSAILQSDQQQSDLGKAMKLQMDSRHKSEAEAKLWFEKAQQWRQELTELLAAAIALRDDMVMRAERDKHLHDGELVVEAGAGVWSRFNRVIGEYQKGRSDAPVE